MASDSAWQKIFDDYNIADHNFDESPFTITAEDIKKACKGFTQTGEREVRILCKQDTREDRPRVFAENGLFILPIKNGIYNIIKGEGYIDIPEITGETEVYESKLDFELDTAKIGNSEMQHLDYAYAASLIRTFTEDKSLVLSIRGRKYTPAFDFFVGRHLINVRSVQTEVDAGYEGRSQIVLVEAKNSGMKNTVIRQLYYPYRQWQEHTNKKVITLFFEKEVGQDAYSVWQFEFQNIHDYNSIRLVKSGKFKIL